MRIDDINDLRNGILLYKGIYSQFGRGAVAFLTTPNFVLRCNDVQRFTGVTSDNVQVNPDYRVTMQYIEPNPSPFAAPEVDIRLGSSESELPPAILLDFMYGAAAYARWRIGDTVNWKVSSYYTAKYEKILSSKGPELDPTTSSDSEQTDPTNNNSDDPEWRPDTSGMLDAMDKVMDISWRVRLRTMPEEVAIRLQKQEEEEELREQEDGRMKVLSWMERTDATISDTVENT